MLSETGNRTWRALSHRIFRRRSSPGNGKNGLEISHALTYSPTQLICSFQLPVIYTSCLKLSIVNIELNK